MNEKGIEDSRSKRTAHFMRGCRNMRNTLEPFDDKNLTDKQENCAFTCQCSCALC